MRVSISFNRWSPSFTRRPSWFSGALGLISCVCVTLLGTEIRNLWRVYNANIEQTEIATATATRLVVEQADMTLQTADTIVASLVERVEADGVGPEARKRLYRLITSLAMALPAIHEMGITDDRGNAIVKSLVPDPVGLNYAERGYFKFHSTNPDRGPFVGARIKSKVDGSYNITLTRRRNNPDGSFAGVVVTSVSMSSFQRLFDQMQAQSGGVIALLSENGTMLARSPPTATADGSATPGRDLLLLLDKRTDPASFTHESTIDGVRRLGSYQHLGRFPLTVLVSQSEWDIQRSWREELLSSFVTMGCVMVVVVLLGSREIKAMRMLKAQALQDGLTGLANRRQFDERLEGEIRRASRTGQLLSLILIDIDRFKAYNDHFGHPGGDECLRRLARTVQDCIHRAGDLAARYGGEEFAVLLPGSNTAQAQEIAEAMRLAVNRLELPQAPSIGGIVTFSAGVATTSPNSGRNAACILIERADTALYAGKANGRNIIMADQPKVAVPRDYADAAD